jgi:hypothetical protein
MNNDDKSPTDFGTDDKPDTDFGYERLFREKMIQNFRQIIRQRSNRKNLFMKQEIDHNE